LALSDAITLSDFMSAEGTSLDITLSEHITLRGPNILPASSLTLTVSYVVV